ncbi:30S ribosome-binding factor RbfA [Buchnera aphidicola (Formosaphis micheliae)]|uniref:30S ribosome-binding factor RbfA n=1 Tax=Buchnera aphidicola TaxID=9 RepID=UPI0031B856BC
MILEYHRSYKIEQELKKQLATIIQYQLRDPRLNIIITISDVKITRDFSCAKIFFTTLNNKVENIQTIISILKNASGFIRILLSKNIKLRIVPKLYFMYDDSFVYGMKITNLINNITKE